MKTSWAMKSSVLCLGLLGAVSGCLGVAGEPSLETDTLDADSQTEAIVGGTVATPHEFPWLARVNGCGGTLVQTDWVLTAAHCVFGRAENSNTLVLGDHDLSVAEPTEVKRTSVKVRMLMGEQDSNNDIALVKMNSPTALSAAVQPIIFGTSAPPVGTMTTIAGWGALAFQQPSDGILRKVQLPVLSLSSCVGVGSTNPLICAGGANGSPGSCNGDSGGPMMFKQPNNTWYVAGIVSGSPACGGPGTYTSVSMFTPWIRSTMYQPTSISARMSDGLVYHRTLDETTQVWSAWTSLGAQSTGPAIALDGAGRQNLFSCNGGTVRFRKTATSTPANWSAWDTMGGNCVAPPAATMDGGMFAQLMVFAIGSDGLVRSSNFAGNLSFWNSLPAVGGFQGGLGAATTRNGRTYVFGRRTTNDIWMTFREANGNAWAAWTSLGGVFTSPPAAHASWDGDLTVAAITSTGMMMKKTLGLTGVWSGWTVAPQGTGFDSTSQPAIVDADNGKDIFFMGRTTANKVKLASYDLVRATWAAFTTLSGAQNLASGVSAL